MRTILAGDPRALVSKGMSDDDKSDVKRAYVTERNDIFVKDIEEGRSNKILHSIRTLVQQTTYAFPEIECEDLEYEESNLHSEYFRQRLGPSPIGCDVVIEMRRALYDFLTGGFGWVWIGMQGGKPTVRWVDTLDCKWDQQSTTTGSGRWWSCTMYGSLEYWQSIFGKGKFAKYLKEANPTPDTPIELEYYYDIEGAEGNWLVLFKTGKDEVDHTPVFKGKNPCWWDYGGQRVPFLPAESMFFMEVPSVRLPIGLIEQMLPSQIALWRVEKGIRDIVDNPAFYEVEKESLDAKQKQVFEDGKVGSVVEREKGSTPIQQHRAMEIPNSLLDWRNYHSDEIIGHSGINPYAAGVGQDVAFAAETQAIRAASGLMAGTISKENADFWLRMLRKYLAKGAAYDEWPLVVRHEEVTLTFDEANPIKRFLKPDARMTIKEDTMQFMDQPTKVALAAKDLEVALKVAPMFPNAVKEAYTAYLRAREVNNIDKFTKPPDPTEMAQMTGQAQAPVPAPVIN